ncbi:MAG: QueT transporter family protein [Coprobacillaceae bacterium]
MNKGISVKLIAINAMIAGVYAVLTLVLSPIAYLEVQCRLSEVMVFLAFYNKRYIPGLVIGCLLANIPSPLGMMDICFGTISTLLVCIAMYYIKNRYIAAIAGSIITGIIIGAELYYAFEIPFLINAFYVFIGELIILVIGAKLFELVENNKKLNSYIMES